MFYTWGVFWMPPHLYTPYIHMPPVCLYAPRGVHTPHMPPYSSMPLCVFWRLCMLWGCNGLPFVLGHPPLSTPVGVASPLLHPPHSVVGSCALVCFRDISMLCGHFPSVRKGLGCFSNHLGVGISTWDVHMLILVPFCSALCLTFRLWLPLLLLQLQWYLLACLPCHQWQWLLPWQDFQ